MLITLGFFDFVLINNINMMHIDLKFFFFPVSQRFVNRNADQLK